MSLWIEFKKILMEYGLEYFSKYYGIYRGTVSDNKDPDKLGRVQLKIPQIYGDDAYEYWSWPAGMFTGNSMGFFAIPNVGDPVWVMFENGEARYPVWTYGHFSDKTKPPTQATKEDAPTNQIWQSTTGHMIELDDTKDKEEIRVTDKSGNKAVMNKDGIVFEDKFGNKIVMKDKFISLVRADKISLGADGGSAEKAVLGDTLKSRLEDIIGQIDALCDALLALTVTTPMGPSGTPINAAQFAAVKGQLAGIKAQLPQALSQYVTLD